MPETAASHVGALLREWRSRRGLSQLDLSLDAGISTRHLSYVETGRAQPSAAMILRLAKQLDVPLRDRNTMLLAAGFAPAYGDRDLDDPEMEAVRAAIGAVLAGHEPYPAVVIDRHWGLIAANDALSIFTDGVAPELLEPPVNVLRLACHPTGLAPRVLNEDEWRSHLLDGLGRKAVTTGDPALAALHAELLTFPRSGRSDIAGGAVTEIATPLRVLAPDGETALSFISTRTQFGTAVDVSLAELSIESFFPVDEVTRDYLQARGEARRAAATSTAAAG